MANTRSYTRSFAGGELAPSMYGRIDDVKYQTGAAKLRNFIATPQGPAENRPGFAYVNATKDNGVARLIPFRFSVKQTMVIEVGAGYFRFHTDGQTLEYEPVSSAWVAPSGDITISSSTPAVVAWTGHGLTTGDPLVFYLYGDHTLADLPTGFKVGYVYTADVVDADHFRILDNGVPVGLTGSIGAGTTNYLGTGTAAASGSAYAGGTMSDISSVLTGLSSVAVPGGIATLNVTLASVLRITDGGEPWLIGGSKGGGIGGTGYASYQYSTDGTHWTEFYSGAPADTTISIAILASDIADIRLRCAVSGKSSVGGSVYVSAAISAWSVDVPASDASTPLDYVRCYRSYPAGATCAYGGQNYVAMRAGVGGNTVPGTDSTVWSLLPETLIYELPNSYTVEDLFDIHYAQSADVVTLVHPNYPPSELRRLGATNWTFTPILTVPMLAAPENVAVTASPGYSAQLSGAAGTPSVFTTSSNHTLSMGDGVYVIGLVIGGVTTNDFYMVAEIPKDGSGAEIPNELKLMDYSGNMVTASLATGATIQYGSKIYDIDNYYVVTAMAADGVNESSVSSEVHVIDNLNVTGSYNTLTWNAVANAARYYIYKRRNGLYGYVGQTTDLKFVDNNIAPDFSITPPIRDTVFNGEGNYPAAVSYFDQRRCFAGTANDPQGVWMTKVGTESDFGYSLPVKDSDRIYFRVATREANKIQHVVPLTQLLLLTESAELRVSSASSDSLTPSNVSVRAQAYTGAGSATPSIINNALVYSAARGGHVREMGYSWQANGFVTGDLSLRAVHLFENQSIVDQAYMKAPRPVVWFVSSNGTLLGLTYIPEEQIGAWHWHDTDGAFESICVVSEGNEDRLYAVIRRTVNNATVRYIERMASRTIDPADNSTWFFVDSGQSQTFESPATNISGLDHLEGKSVAILADGAVCPPQTVTGGAITLPHSASVVHIGLPIAYPDLQTLPVLLPADGFGQGRTKNINKVWLKVYRSGSIFVGPDENHLTEYPVRTTEPYGTPPSLQNGELLPLVLSPSWQEGGQIIIRQPNPLPLTVVGLTLEVSIGG